MTGDWIRLEVAMPWKAFRETTGLARAGVQVLTQGGDDFLIGDMDEAGMTGSCGCCSSHIDEYRTDGEKIVAYRDLLPEPFTHRGS